MFPWREALISPGHEEAGTRQSALQEGCDHYFNLTCDATDRPNALLLQKAEKWVTERATNDYVDTKIQQLLGPSGHRCGANLNITPTRWDLVQIHHPKTGAGIQDRCHSPPECGNDQTPARLADAIG